MQEHDKFRIWWSARIGSHGQLLKSSGLGKPIADMMASFQSAPFIVNGGDGSMVEFAVKKDKTFNTKVKSSYYVPKKDSMFLTMGDS